MIWTNCWTSPKKLECLQKAVGMDNLEGHIETLPLAITITNSFRQHPKIDDENEEIREWLKKYKLRKYYNKFIEHGYDDLDQLLDLSPEKLEHFQKAVGMDNLEGHIERLHPATAIENLIWNNPLPVKDKQEENNLIA